MGILTHFDEIQSDKTCEVQFQLITVDIEEVCMEQRTGETPDTQAKFNQLNVAGNLE